MYLNFYENLTLFNSVTGSRGALIHIDNVSQIVDHGSDGIHISAGTQTLALQRELTSKMPKPYINCEITEDFNQESFDSLLFKLILKTPYAYSQQFCIAHCIQSLFVEKCNCTLSVSKTKIISVRLFSNISFIL